MPIHVLEGLEKEDPALLPAGIDPWVLLRRYAGALGLDGDALTRRWEPGKGGEELPSPNGRRPLMVEARDVRKSYRAEEYIVHALQDVSLSIEKGSLCAVMGPSGCGKTTLLNVLSGLDEIDGGEIFIAGEPLHAMDDARRTGYRARHMGFVFQGFNLMPVLSAVENVELPLLVSGAGVAGARRRALEVLEQVYLADRAHHRPNQLSGGQQQRVAIARALANEPAIVWADEPTGNLDSETSKEVLELLLQLNRENEQTFVVVTHDPEVGSAMDGIIRMEDGRIVSRD
jgi:putative ABC transport system ATP-binding protein